MLTTPLTLYGLERPPARGIADAAVVGARTSALVRSGADGLRNLAHDGASADPSVGATECADVRGSSASRPRHRASGRPNVRTSVGRLVGPQVPASVAVARPLAWGGTTSGVGD